MGLGHCDVNLQNSEALVCEVVCRRCWSRV